MSLLKEQNSLQGGKVAIQLKDKKQVKESFVAQGQEKGKWPASKSSRRHSSVQEHREVNYKSYYDN